MLTEPEFPEARIVYENHVRAGTTIAAVILANDDFEAGFSARGHRGIIYSVQGSGEARRLVTNSGTILAGPGSNGTGEDYWELAHPGGTILHQFRRQAHQASLRGRSLG